MLASSVVAALVLAGCASGGATEPTATPTDEPAASDAFEELVAAAQAEGEVTWYTSVPPPAIGPLVEAFTAKYGITVNVNRQTSSTLATLFESEVASGNHVGDVLGTSDTAIMFPAVEEGTIAALPEVLENAAAWPDDWSRHAAGDTFMHAVGLYTIAYNTQIAGDNPPEEWEDLIDPEWKGKIMMTDPRATAGALGWLVALQDEYGPEFIEALGEQEIKLTNSTATGINSVAAGDVGILVPSSRWNNTELIEQGAPIDDAYPSPSMGGSEQWFGLIEGAPHPNAGALFVDFVLSPEGQSALCTDVCSSPINAPGTLPFPADYTTNDLARARTFEAEIVEMLGLE